MLSPMNIVVIIPRWTAAKESECGGVVFTGTCFATEPTSLPQKTGPKLIPPLKFPPPTVLPLKTSFHKKYSARPAKSTSHDNFCSGLRIKFECLIIVSGDF